MPPKIPRGQGKEGAEGDIKTEEPELKQEGTSSKGKDTEVIPPSTSERPPSSPTVVEISETNKVTIDPRNLTKYDGSNNFRKWKKDIEMSMAALGYTDLIDGTRTVPTEAPTTSADRRVVKDNAHAFYIISSTLVDAASNWIVEYDVTTAKGAWDLLLEKHRPKGNETWVYTLFEAMKDELKPTDSVEAYNHRNNMLVNDMMDSRRTTTILDTKEEYRIATFLAGLPESWDSWMSTTLNILSSQPTGLTHEGLLNAALEEEARRKRRITQRQSKASQGLPSGGESGLKAKTQPSSTLPSSQSKPATPQTGNRYKNIKCFACNKFGHIHTMKKCEKHPEHDPNFVPKHLRSQSQTAGVGVDEDDQDLSYYAPNIDIESEDAGLPHRDSWVLDSGATTHMACNKELLYDIQPYTTKPVLGLGNTKHKVEGIAKAMIGKNLIIDKVLYCPDIATNLISTPRLNDDKCKVIHNEDRTAHVIRGGIEIAAAMYENKGYVVYGLPAMVQKEKFNLNHVRLGHISMGRVEAVENLALGINKSDDNYYCEACILAKSHRQPFKRNVARSTELLHLIHSDVCGPFQRSNKGYQYFVTFTDDYSRMVWIFPMKRKSEVTEKFRTYKSYVENQTGKRIKVLRTDRGGEYVNNELESFLKDQGIAHQTTTPYTPQQNGVSERMNRTVLDMARAMLKFAKLPNSFWIDAVITAAYLRNRVPVKPLKDGKIPYELWNGKKPKLGYLRAFGCIGYAHAFNTTKLQDRAIPTVLVGYSNINQEVKGYRLWDPVGHKYIVSRDVDFNESMFYKDRFRLLDTPEEVYLELCNEEDFIEESAYQPANSEPVITPPPQPESSPTSKATKSVRSENEEDSDWEPILKPSRPKMTSHDEEEYDFEPILQHTRRNNASYMSIQQLGLLTVGIDVDCADETIPQSVQEIMKSPKVKEWLEAMKLEYDALIESDTWYLVDLPPGANVIKGKWLLTIKRDGKGKIIKYKARWVAKGYSQIEGIDYNETFAPASHLSSLRLLLSIATINDYEIHLVDIKTAFLNGTIDHEVYVEQPHHFIDSTNPSKVCRLQKSLYGLKQSPKLWNDALKSWLVANGFTQLASDPSIYIKRHEDNVIMIGVHVDDMLIISNDLKTLDGFEEQLSQRFKLTKESDIQWFLGISARRDRQQRKLYLNQRQYINDILKEFKMENCNPSSSPLPAGFSLELRPWAPFNIITYQKAIGKLLYLARGTRPDISAVVGMLGQYSNNPLMIHWYGIEHLLRYLKKTMESEICLSGSTTDIKAYSDADWGGDLKDRKSRTGVVVMIGDSPIVWASVKQDTVAKSSTEAEYIALTSTVSEVLWIRLIMTELKLLDPSSTTPIFEDNRGCKILAENSQVNPRTKHISIKYHFIRDHIAKGEIKVIACPGSEQIANILTKPIYGTTLDWNKKQLKLS